MHSDPELFPIRTLSARTGVPSATLRAWERRYGLLKPRRTPSGHRLYVGADVDLVRRVTELMQDGLAIGQIAARWRSGQLAEELPGIADDAVGPWRDYRERTVRAIADFSPERLEAIHTEASSLYPLELVTRRLIEPVLRTLGEDWQERPRGVGEEHFYTAWLRNKLGARLHHASGQGGGATLVCAGLPGDSHEIGLLLFVLAAQGHGFRVVYLGPDLPLAQLSAVAERVGARAVIVGAGHYPFDPSVGEELAACRRSMGCPLYIGGRLDAAARELVSEAGARVLGDDVAAALHQLRRQTGSGV
jgi:DNA-binding transcriptional MerR regulator